LARRGRQMKAPSEALLCDVRVTGRFRVRLVVKSARPAPMRVHGCAMQSER
jgi:hypothetical protein